MTLSLDSASPGTWEPNETLNNVMEMNRIHVDTYKAGHFLSVAVWNGRSLAVSPLTLVVPCFASVVWFGQAGHELPRRLGSFQQADVFCADVPAHLHFNPLHAGRGAQLQREKGDSLSTKKSIPFETGEM